MALKFKWDIKKTLANEQKHGVTFEEASTALSDLLAVTIQNDPDMLDDYVL